MNTKKLILVGTGHRPVKLGFKGDPYSSQNFALLVEFLRKELRENPELIETQGVISGMALGFDMALAVAAIKEGIPLVAAVPFEGQELAWPTDSWARRVYGQILERATEVVVVSPGGYSAQKMQARNQWMVDRADRVVALWNTTPGGTANAVRYALCTHKGVYNLWKNWSQVISL